jgi:hypothetical protein
MYSLEVTNNDRQHFTIRADKPVRIESMTIQGKTIVHVYEGTKDDENQEPLFAYDGNNDVSNKDVEIP